MSADKYIYWIGAPGTPRRKEFGVMGPLTNDEIALNVGYMRNQSLEPLFSYDYRPIGSESWTRYEFAAYVRVILGLTPTQFSAYVRVLVSRGKPGLSLKDWVGLALKDWEDEREDAEQFAAGHSEGLLVPVDRVEPFWWDNPAHKVNVEAAWAAVVAIAKGA